MVRYGVIVSDGGDSEGAVVRSEVERYDSDLKHKLLLFELFKETWETLLFTLMHLQQISNTPK